MEPVTYTMSSVVTALTSTITASSIFSVIADLVPFIGIMVSVSLGIYFLRKSVKGAGKAKVRF